MNMAEFITPKSDQLNYDDLLSGPRTIRITKVAGTGNTDQPVSVHFEGDNGKPWKPCKSMRRVLVAAWGVDASTYVGRSVTLFGDPKVVFGGIACGGIRISHLSHIDNPLQLALTISKAKRAPYKVAQIVEQNGGVNGPTPSPAPAVDPATDDGNLKGYGPSAPESTGSGGGASTEFRETHGVGPGKRSEVGGEDVNSSATRASAWDRHTANGDYQAGNPFTREVRRFATVEQWCAAICALAHERTDAERARLWKANAKTADFITDESGERSQAAQMVSAAHTFVTAPDPVMGSAG